MPVRARVRGHRITLEGDERVRAKLVRAGGRFSDLRWMWSDVAELFVEKEKGWFQARGRGTWPPLSPAYARWKAIHFPGRPLLVRTGDMHNQLTSQQKAVLVETHRTLVLGTTVPYAIFHAEGTSRMPARPPMIPVVSLAAGVARRVQAEIERVF